MAKTCDLVLQNKQDGPEKGEGGNTIVTVFMVKNYPTKA